MTTLLFHKPYGVLCQFSSNGRRRTLAGFIEVKNVYPAGRLDTDSEGLVVLTDDGRLQNRITHPEHKWPKTYWVQVEGIPPENYLEQICRGILLKDGPSLPAAADQIPESAILWPRNPPIRVRKAIPTAWIKLTLREGRNRQVRRMIAAIGFPTLRLIRWRIGAWDISGLLPGEWRRIQTVS